MTTGCRKTVHCSHRQSNTEHGSDHIHKQRRDSQKRWREKWGKKWPAEANSEESKRHSAQTAGAHIRGSAQTFTGLPTGPETRKHLVVASGGVGAGPAPRAAAADGSVGGAGGGGQAGRASEGARRGKAAGALPREGWRRTRLEPPVCDSAHGCCGCRCSRSDDLARIVEVRRMSCLDVCTSNGWCHKGRPRHGITVVIANRGCKTVAFQPEKDALLQLYQAHLPPQTPAIYYPPSDPRPQPLLKLLRHGLELCTRRTPTVQPSASAHQSVCVLQAPTEHSRITLRSALRQWAWNRSSSSAARRRNALSSGPAASPRGTETGSDGKACSVRSRRSWRSRCTGREGEK